MKKKLMMLMMLMSAFSASAQLSVTPEIGMTAFKKAENSSIIENVSQWCAGWKAGAAVEYQFEGRAFALQSGLFYTQKRYKEQSYPYLPYMAENVIAFYNGYSNNHYLQIPLLAKFSWRLMEDVRMHIAFGPVVEISTGNTGKGSSYAIELDQLIDGTYQFWSGGSYLGGEYYASLSHHSKDPTQWGAMATVGLDIKNWVVKGTYDMTFSDELDFPWINYHTFSLTVGYKFKLTK